MLALNNEEGQVSIIMHSKETEGEKNWLKLTS